MAANLFFFQERSKILLSKGTAKEILYRWECHLRAVFLNPTAYLLWNLPLLEHCWRFADYYPRSHC